MKLTKNPMAHSLQIVIKWPYSAPSRRKGATFKVMAGSPENRTLVFEITRFKAGRITFASCKMSFSFRLNSCFFSAWFLWRIEFEKNETPKKGIANCDRAEKMLKFNPFVKEEDNKQREPNPNQRVDFDTSFHIIKSIKSCQTRSKSTPFSSSVFGDEVEGGTEGTKFTFSFFDRTLFLLFLGFPTSSANPISFSSRTSSSERFLGLRVLFGDWSTPIWDSPFLRRRRGAAGSGNSSAAISMRVLDLRRGEGDGDLVVVVSRDIGRGSSLGLWAMEGFEGGEMGVEWSMDWIAGIAKALRDYMIFMEMGCKRLVKGFSLSVGVFENSNAAILGSK